MINLWTSNRRLVGHTSNFTYFTIVNPLVPLVSWLLGDLGEHFHIFTACFKINGVFVLAIWL